jgi:Tol biopolymer transport system component
MFGDSRGQYTAAMRVLLLLAALTSGMQTPAAQPAQPAAPPPGTDIYLLATPAGLASIKTAKPSPVSTAPGYDNQPMFSPDGTRILFSANHDGKQTDIYAFDRAGGRVSQLTRTAENENSPTFLPAGIGAAGGFSVVRTEMDKERTQRLWRFDAQGGNPQLVLTEIKPVGYHAWIDADRLGLFVLGQPNSLQLATVKSGKGEVVASGIGRSLHTVPGTRSISFVHREPSGEFWIKQIDVDSKKIEPLTTVVEGNNERDMAWTADGKTILMSGGSKIYAWTRGGSGWTEVFDAAAHNLGAVSRLAVSPKGDAIAIVVSEPKK